MHENLLQNCLENNAAYPGSYDFVRKLCAAADTAHQQASALAAALAAYRRPTDIPLLSRFGPQDFEAIANFPDPAFWPLIERYRATMAAKRSVAYYRAVATYHTRPAAQLLDSLIRHGLTNDIGASNINNVLIFRDK